MSIGSHAGSRVVEKNAVDVAVANRRHGSPEAVVILGIEYGDQRVGTSYRHERE